jgi:uncharacterized protein YegP (UPF0339 family)
MRIHLYQSEDGFWYWRILAQNGETIAESPEGYRDRSYAISSARKVYPEAEPTLTMGEVEMLLERLRTRNQTPRSPFPPLPSEKELLLDVLRRLQAIQLHFGIRGANDPIPVDYSEARRKWEEKFHKEFPDETG